MFAQGCIMILVSKASGKTLRSYHGVAQGIGGHGAHGMGVFLDVIHGLQCLLYILCFPLSWLSLSSVEGSFTQAWSHCSTEHAHLSALACNTQWKDYRKCQY